MDSTKATIHPIGQDSQIPVLPNLPARKKARMTRSTRSAKVAVINCLMAPAPLNTPSAINFTAIKK